MYTLIPYDAREGLSVKEAAAAAGKSARTVTAWCERHGIGRKVAGGVWVVSRVALQMLLDGADEALKAYRDFGVRRSYEPVAEYFRRLGLGDLLDTMTEPSKAG
jgi:hypothetical protein